MGKIINILSNSTYCLIVTASIFVLIIGSTESFAKCNVESNSLNILYNRLSDGISFRRRNGDITNADFELLSTDEVLVSVKSPRLGNASIPKFEAHHQFPAAGSISEKYQYLGWLIVADGTKNAINLRTAAPNAALMWGATLDRLSLGDAGAIALLPTGDLANCSQEPNPIYVLPKSAAGVDNLLEKQIIRLPDDQWDHVVALILVHNSQGRLAGDTVEAVLDREGEKTAANIRANSVGSPFLTSILTNLELPRNSLQIASPTTHDNFDYVQAATADPAVIEILRNSKNLSDYFSKKHIIETKIADNTATDTELELEMSKLQNLILATRALSDFQKKAMDKAKRQAEIYGRDDPVYITNYGMMQRIMINQDSVVEQLARESERFYTLLKRTPVYPIGETFDRQKLLTSNYRDANLPCNLDVQTLTLPQSNLSFFKEPLKFDGQIYLTYSPAKDPITNAERVRLRAYAALKMPNLSTTHKNVVQARIPKSSCRHRFADDGGYSQSASKGSLVGSSNSRYEKWICEDHYWICFKGWVPRECKKDIKTRVFSVERKLNFVLDAFLAGNDKTLKFSGRSSYGYNFNEVFHLSQILSDNSAAQATSDIAGVSWGAARFVSDGNNSNRAMFLINGNSGLKRPNTACGIHDAISKMD